MGLKQFANSLRSIAGNPHIHRGKGIVRHCLWQGRKAFNLFPFEQTISRSRIIAAHRCCGVSALIYNQGLYNYNNMKLLQWLLRDGGVFLDVGANIGSYTLIASEQEEARVFAFEPHPRTFQLLKENVELNNRKNVTLFNVALADWVGRAFLTDEDRSATNHLEPDGRSGTIPVPCMRAETVCVAHRVTPNYVKVDVEGFEHDVLQGFGDSLRSVDVFFIEINGLSNVRPGGGDAIHQLLTAGGFRGPFAYEFDTKRLFPRRSQTSEDSLYLSRSFHRMLPAWGLRIVEGR